MTYTASFSIALGSSQTGLTLEAQLKDTAGVNVGAAITAGFIEIGVGNYLFTGTAIPDGHRGGVVFQISPAGAIKAFAAVNPEELENVDAKLTTRATPAQVNTEVVDVLKVDTIPEQSQGIPPATPTFEQAQAWFWHTWRNSLTASSSQAKVRNTAGTVLAKAGLSDAAGEFKKDKFVSGP